MTLTGHHLRALLEIQEQQALKNYRYHRNRREGIYDTARFAAALYARAEWNALLRLSERNRAA